jgi:alpha-ribazole phosphatase
MIITAVRHTSVNVPSEICYGITDVSLAPTFRNELESIRQTLTGEPFDAIFSSPMSRCTKLANELFPGSQVLIDQRLIELDFGDWEMTSWNTIFESPEGKVWFADYVNSACPGGESFTDLIKRGKTFLNDLRQTNFQNVVLFSHAGMIRAMMCLLQHKTPEEAFQTPLIYGQTLSFNFE